MTKDEALRMALEALEDNQHFIETYERPEYLVMYNDVIDKCKEALAKEKTLQALHDENKRLGLYKDAYAEQEPIKITHKHEWFRTGEMKVGQMRCISCGAWGQEEITQRTWVGLTDMEKQMLINKHEGVAWEIANAVEQQIKEKNK